MVHRKLVGAQTGQVTSNDQRNIPQCIMPCLRIKSGEKKKKKKLEEKGTFRAMAFV